MDRPSFVPSHFLPMVRLFYLPVEAGVAVPVAAVAFADVFASSIL